MSNRAFKYRVYPNKEQQILFAKTFGCCRKIYNLMLADKIECYENTKTFGKQTPAKVNIVSFRYSNPKRRVVIHIRQTTRRVRSKF